LLVVVVVVVVVELLFDAVAELSFVSVESLLIVAELFVVVVGWKTSVAANQHQPVFIYSEAE
jgi:hypothetical protein